MATQTQQTALRTPRRGDHGAANLFMVIFALAVVANFGVMIWFWLRDGGVTGQVIGVAGALTTAGRITGLIGAYFALLQVLLLARLPPLERRIGMDRLAVWHRINGKLVIYLVVAHVILITIGYAGLGHTGWISQFGSFLSSYKGMVTATIGTVLMIVTVITSLVIARRRLSYEAWYAVHLTVYGGIFLAYLHQLPTGWDFKANNTWHNMPLAAKLQSDWWVALYVATLALLIVYRVLIPLVRFYREGLRVESVERVSADVVTITVAGKRLDRVHAAGGQFLLWRFMSKGLWWQSHPFSLSAAPDGRTLRITVKAVGDYTRSLLQVPVGTRVFAEGPFGRFVATRRQRPHVTMIAGGIGVTPLRAILEELDDCDVTFIYRGVSDADLVLRDEIEQLTASRGAQLHELVGDHADPRYADLLGPENLRALAPHIANSDVFLCGPLPMMHHTIDSLRQLGVPKHQIHWESFAFAVS